MLPPGFEPESSARKAEMIGRTTLREPEPCLPIILFQFCPVGFLQGKTAIFPCQGGGENLISKNIVAD